MEEMKNPDSGFMKETIKKRPLNRRKLLRRTLITALMAVIFGLVACFTFLLLEPIISKHLYPEEEPEMVIFTEEPEDEILPEDMFVDDSQMQPEPSGAPALVDEQIAQVLSEVEFGIEDYNSLYKGLSEMAAEVEKSMVTVVGVNSEIDWFNNAYEYEGKISGVIIADNGVELLIMANVESIEDAETLKVTFVDGKQCTATVKKKDNNINLAVLSVRKAVIPRETMDSIAIVEMGSSAGRSLVGNPIIAIGQPMGVPGSLCYGFITSAGSVIHLPDSVYKLITTDIYGSQSATGILVNMKGQMIGMIDAVGHNNDAENLICAIGITELKKVVQNLSNDSEIPYFGIYGADVTVDAHQELGVPYGAYIMEIEMDSPAMEAGIQSGDVIINMYGYEVNTYTELISYLIEKNPEETTDIVLCRQGPEGYTEMELQIILRQKADD